MKNFKFIGVALATLATTGSAFGVVVVGTRYDLKSATAGFGGYIELNSSSGSWDGSGTDNPIISFNIITPDLAPGENFNSSNPDVSITLLNQIVNPTFVISGTPNPARPVLTWNSDEITSIDLQFTDSDPADITFIGGPDINFNLDNGLVTGQANLDVPDQGATGLMLAAVCGAIGTLQAMKRRRQTVS